MKEITRFLAGLLVTIVLGVAINAQAAPVRFDFSGTAWPNTLGTDTPGSAFVSFSGFVSIDESRLGTAVLGTYFLDWGVNVALTSNDARLGGSAGAVYSELYTPQNASLSTVGTNRGGAILDLTGSAPELQMLVADLSRSTMTGVEVNNWRYSYAYAMLSFKSSFYSPPLASSQQFRGTFSLSEASAVPVPPALLLMGSGLLGLVGIRKKRP